MADEDPAYLEWVRGQPCCAPGSRLAAVKWVPAPCRGPIQAHHQDGAGIGMRAHDHTAIPLCLEHHTGRGWHLHQGPFKGWSKERRRDWTEEQISRHRSRYLGTIDSGGPECPF